MQNKSTELNTGKLDASVAQLYKDEAEKEAERFEADPNSNDHPLVQEFKKSQINFQELIDTKISTKGQQLSDLKKRSEESKSLIIALRKAVAELLGKRDAVIDRAIDMEREAADKLWKTQERVTELEAAVLQSKEAMNVSNDQISQLQEQYRALELRLTSCDEAKATALARVYELDKEVASEKTNRESTQVWSCVIAC